MRKSALWLSLCLSSLLVAVSLVTATTVKTSVIPNTAIAQANPCAGRNPCASKNANVGGPLAKELQGKPVVVDIYASWCSKCKNIAPTLSQLKQQYAGKVHFVVLDVSDKSTSTQAEVTAKKLGLGQFFSANRTQTGMLTIIDPATGNILTQHRNNADKAAYTTVLDRAIAKK